MSIELDIKVVRPVPVVDLAASVAAQLRGNFSDAPAAEWAGLDGRIGDPEHSVRVTCGAEAVVGITSVAVAFDGPDGGTWASVAVHLRTPESFLLMLVVATELARATGSPITDDARMLDAGTEVDPSAVARLVEEHHGGSFSEVSKRIERRKAPPPSVRA
jgi:hypothetical protein